MRQSDENIRQFNQISGSDRLRKPKYLVLLVAILGISFWFMMKLGVAGGIGLIALPLLFWYFYWLFSKPIIGFYSILIAGFALLGLSRYIPDNIQLGMFVDALFFLSYLALFFSKFYERIDWSPAKKDITLLAAIWLGYGLLQVLNPEVQSRAAWLSGVRGISLYMMLLVPLVLMFIDDNRKLDRFLFVWGLFSLFASLKAVMQVTLGPDPWEKAWLATDEGLTHIIFGNLRAFSFMTDAGQFGANQGYSAVMATIVAFSGISSGKKIFFLTVAALGFLGMFLSGTRGAISIPLAGFFLFFILRKNLVVMISGFVLLLVIFAFFKFTYIGQNNQFIRRMRSAFNPNDPSLQVRINNQRILQDYLKTRPFGGGIGHAGAKARQYLPNAFLSNVPTDSWYVMIWAEQGIVGLVLHLFILFYIMIKGSFLIMFRVRDPVLKMKMTALAAGMFGVMVASYGNAVLGTMPTSFLIYTTMALLLNVKVLDQAANPEKIESENKI